MGAARRAGFLRFLVQACAILSGFFVGGCSRNDVAEPEASAFGQPAARSEQAGVEHERQRREILSPNPRVPPADGVCRLAILIIFDQMRGDYLTRWRHLFCEGGFRRIEKEGTSFANCHFPFAFTVTGAGHASIATGAMPAKHGITVNAWYDRSAEERVNCVTSDRYEQLPPWIAKPDHANSNSQPRGVTPQRLLSPTLADAIKEATGGKGRVVSLSFKDRSAALLAGRKPDACYWVDMNTGTFVTSTYYRDRVHSWVAEYNRRKPADAWFGLSWDKLLPQLDYQRHSGPDDVAGEGIGYHQGRTFPHPMTGGLRAPGKEYYYAVENSPFGNELLLGLAKLAIDAEKLGRRDTPDLMCLSFSSNDIVGHCYGPDSQEVLDVTLRSDRIVKSLLDHLDATVGKGRYVLALTSDHGVCPLPEVSHLRGIPSGRIPITMLMGQAEDFLQATYPKKDGDRTLWIEWASHQWIYLNTDKIRRYELKSAEVEKKLADWLARQPGMQSAYTRTQLLRDDFASDPIGQMVKRSFHPHRCGDLALVPMPYHFITEYLTGTSHGTPHPYDTHVPLLLLGPGLGSGIRQEKVTPLIIPAILARSLGILPPADAQTQQADLIRSAGK